MVLTDKLTAIGNAIRAKTGEADLLTLDAMPVAIEGIETGGADLPEEAFNLTGNTSQMFSNNNWKWFIDGYGNKVKTKNLTSTSHMF
jgi:hypothetical protein